MGRLCGSSQEILDLTLSVSPALHSWMRANCSPPDRKAIITYLQALRLPSDGPGSTRGRPRARRAAPPNADAPLLGRSAGPLVISGVSDVHSRPAGCSPAPLVVTSCRWPLAFRSQPDQSLPPLERSYNTHLQSPFSHLTHLLRPSATSRETVRRDLPPLGARPPSAYLYLCVPRWLLRKLEKAGDLALTACRSSGNPLELTSKTDAPDLIRCSVPALLSSIMLSTIPLASLLALVPAVLAHGNHGMPDTPAIRAAGVAHRAKYDAWLAARRKRDSTWQDEAAILGTSDHLHSFAVR